MCTRVFNCATPRPHTHPHPHPHHTGGAIDPQTQLSVLYSSVCIASFSQQNVMPALFQLRPLFYRERGAGVYGTFVVGAFLFVCYHFLTFLSLSVHIYIPIPSHNNDPTHPTPPHKTQAPPPTASHSTRPTSS